MTDPIIQVDYSFGIAGVVFRASIKEVTQAIFDALALTLDKDPEVLLGQIEDMLEIPNLESKFHEKLLVALRAKQTEIEVRKEQKRSETVLLLNAIEDLRSARIDPSQEKVLVALKEKLKEIQAHQVQEP